MSATRETRRRASAQVKIAGRLSYFVMPSEYASPDRTETSLAIFSFKFRDPSTALGMTKMVFTRAELQSYGGDFAGR